jgi:3-dehydroquinate synthetase
MRSDQAGSRVRPYFGVKLRLISKNRISAPAFKAHCGPSGIQSQIVRSDESESVMNDSATSRKILNFGHTFGHALEKATDYNYLKHGEAVGHGLFSLPNSQKSLNFSTKMK